MNKTPWTESEVRELLRQQRKICADMAVIDYAEPDKLALLIQAPEPVSFIGFNDKESGEVAVCSVEGCKLPATCNGKCGGHCDCLAG